MLFKFLNSIEIHQTKFFEIFLLNFGKKDDKEVDEKTWPYDSKQNRAQI
jgi:hypothetical protein